MLGAERRQFVALSRSRVVASVRIDVTFHVLQFVSQSRLYLIQLDVLSLIESVSGHDVMAGYLVPLLSVDFV